MMKLCEQFQCELCDQLCFKNWPQGYIYALINVMFHINLIIYITVFGLL